MLLGACNKLDTNFQKSPAQGGPVIQKHEGIDYTGAFNLNVDQFDSCSQIQEEIRSQFIIKQENERARRKYYQSIQKNQVDEQVDNPVYTTEGMPVLEADNSVSSQDNEESFTNVQESGVDESDTFKIGASHIFSLNGSNLLVTGRKELNVIGKIKIDDLTNIKLFSNGNRLTIMGIKQELKSICYDKTSSSSIVHEQEESTEKTTLSECSSMNIEKTVVRIFAGKENELPKIIHERSSEGRYMDSRFVNGHLLFVTPAKLALKTNSGKIMEICGDNSHCYQSYYRRKYNSHSNYGNYSLSVPPMTESEHYPIFHFRDGFDIDEEIPEEVIEVENGRINGVLCSQIGKPAAGDMDMRMTIVRSIDTNDLSIESKTVATLGGGEQIYMTASGLYIAKKGLNWQPWVHPENEDAENRNYWRDANETLVVSKVNFNKLDGSITVAAVGAVMGRIKDQWAFKEYSESGVLVIATTTRYPLQDTESRGQRNHLWILNQENEKLELLSSIQDFGPNEDIRSVRYLGSIAYIVTYHKTDPLFAFELKNPENPQILGELKVPGFSMYLHPFSHDKLIGVGFDADERGSFSYFQGVQVSLFDTKNKAMMERIDHQIIGHRGSYSDVTGDHKAFFMDKQNSMIALPAVELTGAGEGKGSGYAKTLEFSGAIFYKLNDHGLDEAGRVSHDDLIPEMCKGEIATPSWWTAKRRSVDINRIFKVDGRILTLSRFGIKSYSPEDLTLLQTVRFDLEDKEINCKTY